MDLRIWAPLSLLDQSILDRVRLAFVFGSEGRDALLVTEDDEVLACGSNTHGCLGIGTKTPSLKPTSVAELNKARVKGFSFGYNSEVSFMVAWTFTGKVYTWGRKLGEDVYIFSLRGYPRVDGLLEPTILYSPTLVSFPCESVHVSDVACGTNHCLALTKDGKVYSWGNNNHGQLGIGNPYKARSVEPILIEGHLKDERVTKISCGDDFSVVLLDNGEVYAWGHNRNGKIGLSRETICEQSPVQVCLMNDVVKDLVCGKAYTLVVTNIGSIYGWGKNDRGQLGLGNEYSPRYFPAKIPTVEKFVSVAAHCSCSTSAAMNSKSEVFVWGDLPDFHSSTPQKTTYKSLQEVFTYLALPRVMYKPVDHRLQNQSKFSVIPGKRFQDTATSDLTITAGGKEIFVHRDILSSRSDYFRAFLQEPWLKENERVLNIDQTYVVIHSYLRYLYTGEIQIDPDFVPELLMLAQEYQDETFKELCDECLQCDIDIDNVAEVFACAFKVEAPKLLERCMAFAACHMYDVLPKPAVHEWDEDTKREFLKQCSKRKLFKF